jgi:hypothetical protein
MWDGLLFVQALRKRHHRGTETGRRVSRGFVSFATVRPFSLARRAIVALGGDGLAGGALCSGPLRQGEGVGGGEGGDEDSG